MNILLVEDDQALAEVMCEVLVWQQHGVTHASSVNNALALLDESARPDAAMLDINVGSCLVYDVADRLEVLGIPFLFTSATDSDEVPSRFSTRRYLRKPYSIHMLLNSLRDMVPTVFLPAPQGRA